MQACLNNYFLVDQSVLLALYDKSMCLNGKTFFVREIDSTNSALKENRNSEIANKILCSRNKITIWVREISSFNCCYVGFLWHLVPIAIYTLSIHYSHNSCFPCRYFRWCIEEEIAIRSNWALSNCSSFWLGSLFYDRFLMNIIEAKASKA